MIEYVWTQNHLTKEGYRVRFTVFVLEQHFAIETDERDFHCWHLLARKDGQPFGAARIFSDDGKEWHIGRVSVLPEFRGCGAGAALLAECERKVKSLGAERFALDAQVRVRSFYERAGYTAVGEEHLDEYCPHILMQKSAQDV